MISIIIGAFQLLLPVYFANAAPTFLIKFKKHPLDFGKKWGKNRLLGNGKTIEGVVFACFVGFLTGILLKYAYYYFNFSWINISPFGYAFIALGAMIGDSGGSFIKRRLGMKRGENAGLLDMIDFMVGGLIFARIISPYSWWIAIIGLILTPIIHRVSNIIGYEIGVKKEPW
ncbi:MAG: CDP-2,3-bis-(O-geranylgeranyl)-sn-glycerol synthase [Candidatus Nanoarchaeia archaeon]|nr:CDP-2,3-bis-(O-geranylgeranyl)-sn-glycerol synthase [Candidatus Nanoarchaeia archaeon]MDD5499548.1 CDP-2,3-bis-(O-geranylgeranyl)-sn-glycerol synthase [Candidatus Nanoarchaeia archaeon]